jgi:hypothetical protein
MRRSYASVSVIRCEPCWNLGLPEPRTRGEIPCWGDRMQVCHQAMDHVRSTGHEPVTVIETVTAVYGKPDLP